MLGAVFAVLCLAAVTLGQTTRPTTTTRNPTYVIVTPSLMRPGMKLSLSVHILRATSTVTVEAFLRSQTDNTTVQGSSVDGDFVQGTPGILEMTVPSSLPASTYTLVVRGRLGASTSYLFMNTTSIRVERKTLSIFIQSDKAIYKPGQTVKFRAMVVHPDLKPYLDTMNIEIWDAKGNKIRQWLNQKDANFGVVSLEMPLSADPLLGDWKIKVIVGTLFSEKIFAVDEYVLPKFEVIVDTPSFLVLGSNEIAFSVKAKYTFGNPVSGPVCATIRLGNYYYRMNEDMSMKNCMELDKEGKAEYRITFQQLMDNLFDKTRTYETLATLRGKDIKIQAQVTEAITGKVMEKNASVTIQYSALSIQFTSATPTNYKPGLSFFGYIKVSRPDGTPPMANDLISPTNETAKVQLNADVSQCTYPPGSGFQPSSLQSIELLEVPPSGVIAFAMSLPNCQYLSLNAMIQTRDMDNSASAYHSAEPVKTLGQYALQISMEGSDAMIRADATHTFTLNSTNPVSSCNVQLLSKGAIVISRTINMNNRNIMTFDLDIDAAYALLLSPSARMVAWYITPAGEVIADSIELLVEETFANEVSIKFDPERAAPADTIQLEVTANANSFVGILAVDQSVLLLRSGNDITQDDVMNELKMYDSSTIRRDIYYPMMFDGKRKKRCVGRGCGMSYYPIFSGGKDTSSIFENAGVYAMSDAYIHKIPIRYYPSMSGLPAFGVAGPAGPAGAPGMAGPQAEAGRVAASGAPTSSVPTGVAEPTRTRSLFPETWLWTEDLRSGADGRIIVDATVPDVITSWVASAFAMHPQSGLGVAGETSVLTVEQPFFATLNLPYSIIRGEQTVLQVLIHNYLQSVQQVWITLVKSDKYNVKDKDGQVMPGDAVQMISIQPNTIGSVSYWIQPLALGQVELYVKAQSTAAADALKRNLLVEPEGIPKERTEPYLIRLTDTQSFTKVVPIAPAFPADTVPGSQQVTVTAIGDIMGPAINNLDSLLQMPYGCGEQNMLNFAADIYIMNYLVATGQDTEAIRTKAINFMIQGYQRELQYQRADGSFSAFGNNDPSGSTWLSAFVLKCFVESIRYIDIDPATLRKTAKWIMEQQQFNGTFDEPGRVIHSDMQGGASGGVAMSAYTLISLLESNGIIPEGMDEITYKSKLAVTQRYLEGQVTNLMSKKDNYTMALVAYALQLARSSMADQVFNYMIGISILKDGERYWVFKPEEDVSNQNSFYRPPTRSQDVEMTGYMLMVYTLKTQITEALPVMKWLISKRNANGGFSSTQDTVIGLQSLSDYASNVLELNSLNINVNLLSSSMTSGFAFDPLNSVNSIVLQSYTMNPSDTNLTITATGSGMGLVTVAWKYNVFTANTKPKIQLDVDSEKLTDNSVIVKPCVTYNGVDGESGMTIVEMQTLSGYVTAEDLNDVKNKYGDLGMKRVEVDGKITTFYFDKFNSTKTCWEIRTESVELVTNIKDGFVRAMSYYKPDENSVAFYKADPNDQGSVDQCELCPSCCIDNRPTGPPPSVISTTTTTTTTTTTRMQTTRDPNAPIIIPGFDKGPGNMGSGASTTAAISLTLLLIITAILRL